MGQNTTITRLQAWPPAHHTIQYHLSTLSPRNACEATGLLITASEKYGSLFHRAGAVWLLLLASYVSPK